MIKKASVAACLAAAAALVTVGCGPVGGGPPQSAHPSPTPTASPAVTGWVTIHGDVWIPAVDALGGHLVEAEKALKADETSRAAGELYGAAELLQEKAADADEESSRSLQATADQLNAAGADLENGRTVSADRFDNLLDQAWEADMTYGWAPADAATWDQIVHEPERLLELALAQLDIGESESASELLRKAASMIRIEAKRAENVVDEEELVAARMDLREIANEIDEHEVQNAARVGTVAARAAHALARHHQLIAEHEYQIGNPEDAGRALATSVASLERAYEWSGTAMEPETEATLAQARAVATDSEVEDHPAGEDLESQLIAVGSEIDQLAATVVPPWLHADIG
jgi:hypothetical protein